MRSSSRKRPRGSGVWAVVRWLDRTRSAALPPYTVVRAPQDIPANLVVIVWRFADAKDAERYAALLCRQIQWQPPFTYPPNLEGIVAGEPWPPPRSHHRKDP